MALAHNIMILLIVKVFYRAGHSTFLRVEKGTFYFSNKADRGRDAGCPAPPAQIRT
jgi:hypothetical protein